VNAAPEASSPELDPLEVMASLADAGYLATFELGHQGMRCPKGCPVAPVVEQTFRFEGASDPDDESILLALSCPACGTKGTLLLPYGPAMDGPEAAALARLPGPA
jgi:hypothetical protein